MGIDYIRTNRGDFNSGDVLSLSKMPKEPFDVFEAWLSEAIGNEVQEPYAMSISTVDGAGLPHSRIVYLRDVNNEKLTFFSNYASQKGTNLEVNPHISALFFWPELHKQIRIEGKVQLADPQTSDDYFAARPRKSQLGAWASEQSSELESRAILEQRLIELEKQFEGKEIPRPDGWGGYVIHANYYEFWLGQPSRLHDRIVYKKTKENWIIYRLNP